MCICIKTETLKMGLLTIAITVAVLLEKGIIA